YDDRAYDDRAYDDQWDGQPDGSVLGVADPSYTHWEGRRRPETSVGWRWARFRRRREGAAGRGRSEPGPTSLDAPLVHFRYHGRDLAAPSGSTVAGGLLANGERSWRTTRARGQRRGLFCGIGTCFDCLVELNGDRPVRACLSPLNEGDDVGGIGPARVAPVRSPTIEGTASVDLVVVGAGPAGMAAAAAAASRGAEVVLVDGGSRLGGQFFRQPVAEGTVGPVPAAGECLPVRFHSLVGNPRIQLRLGFEVWSATTGSSGFELRLGGDEPGPVRSRALVLATGASELALPFPGWELPGVMTAGAAQALLKSQEVAAGRQVVVAGTGPFLLPVAAALSETGATVVVVEAARARLAPQALASLLEHPSKLKEAGGYGSVFMRNRVRLLTGRAVVRCEGDGEVQWAVVARLGPNWEPIAGSEQRLPADAVCASYGFVPRVELARQLDARDMASPRHPSVHVACDEMMSSSVPGLFVAGEVSGIAGAGVAEIEGELAGHAAARYLGLADYRTHSDRQKAARRLATGRAFAARLETLYPLYPGWISWLERSTVFCRCEQTSWRAVEAAVISGATSAREVRNLTRCGMGYCQGRTCGPALQLAVSALTGRPLDQVGDLHKRPVAVPVPLETVARSAPASP
ncbi:MAG TPA: FAD-dependent oxidoreductase, partial [Acidimicrobiales bacterium]|nr:FAD-dependent oxidoreductase [Acidimicrobiales bacterium]